MIISSAQFIIIVAVCTWYFSHGADVEGKASVFKGFKWLFRYHFGSIAFGSLILAIVWAIRMIFEFMRRKLTAANPSPIVTQIACVLSYCLWCLNRFIKFINKNAYIQIALKSDNFCTAAWNAFILILRNAPKFGFVSVVGTIFMYVGKFFISSLVALLAFVLAAYWPWMRE